MQNWIDTFRENCMRTKWNSIQKDSSEDDIYIGFRFDRRVENNSLATVIWGHGNNRSNFVNRTQREHTKETKKFPHTSQDKLDVYPRMIPYSNRFFLKLDSMRVIADELCPKDSGARQSLVLFIETGGFEKIEKLYDMVIKKVMLDKIEESLLLLKKLHSFVVANQPIADPIDDTLMSKIKDVI